ncbi:MAG TPA: MBG domain-containing protein, partial [Bacteroidia bacterium]|nr:MBG domain-containing protein [Bacteroidia bacterium]
LLNLSLAASSGAITNGRILSGQGGNSSLIVDLAPQSVFDFIDNVDPLQLISGFAGENPRSLLDGDVITNRATGRVVTNGATGRVVTNRATGRVVTNSTPGTNSNKKLAFLIDSIDVFDTITHEIESINSIHLITGTTVGTWRMTPAAFISDNFDVSYGIGALTITKAPLTIAADNKNKFYGSPNPPFTLTYSGFVNGDDESSVIPPVVSSPALTTSPAGSYLIKVNGGTSSNYTLTKIPGTLTIKKVVLIATADNKSKVYGTANPPLTISYTGFVNGEGVDSIASLPFAATNATVLSGVGNYAIALTGGSDNNYSFTKVNGTLSITKANLVAKADNKSKIYGSSNPAFTISYSGFVNGDDATSVSAPTASSSALKLSSVGNYPINLSGGSSSNYSFTYQSGTLTINPAALIVSADNKTIAAGASLPTFTYSTSGFVSNGANTVASGPQYAVSPVYSGAVGTYTISPSALVLSQPNNYSISYVAGTLTVSTSTTSSKKIEVELECVDTLINDPSGFKYIARFEYENDNCYSVTIPIGTDNSLVGTYSGTQPSVFLPGENYFNVKFNGSLLTWTVKSYEGTTKKTSTASATKSSRSCYCSSSRLAFVSESMEEVESTTFSLYPNPSSDKIYVSSSFEFTSETSISVLDIVGREQFAQRVVKKDGNKLEMDIHSLTKGIYFVKITNGLEQFTLRFVKE